MRDHLPGLMESSGHGSLNMRRSGMGLESQNPFSRLYFVLDLPNSMYLCRVQPTH